MLSKICTLFILLVSISACKESNFIKVTDENGNISEKYSINNDSLKHGEYTSFINGALVEKANFSSGKLDGPRYIYHPNGQIEIEETYNDDVLIGDYKTYFSNGVLSQSANYKSGMMQGTLKTFYKDGSLKEEVTMLDNEENGPFKEYFQNGKVKWEGQFLNGDNEFGLLKNYNEEGTLVKKMMCDSLGVCATIWTLEAGDINPN